MRLHHWLFGSLLVLLPVQLGYHFWFPWSYVFGLRIDYLSPTLFLTDILVLLILLVWTLDDLRANQLRVILRLRSGQASYWLKRHWWILAFFIFLFFSSLLAQNQGAALYKFLKILEFSFLGLYIAKNTSVSRILSCALSIPILYSSLMAIVQFFKQSSLGGIFWFLGERTFNSATPGIAKIDFTGRLLMRPYASFPHPNALAGFLLVGLVLTLPNLLKKNIFLAVCLLLLATIGLVVSFSRSVWFIALLLAVGWISVKIKGKRLYLWLLLTVLLIPLGIWFKELMGQESFLQRIDLARVAWLMIRQNPLMGIGLNNFIPAIPSFWSNINQTYWLQPVHNIYLLVAAETGLTGLLIFLWFLFLTYKRLLSHGPLNYNLLFALTIILLLGLFDHYWLTLQQTQLLFCIVLGFAWGKTRS